MSLCCIDIEWVSQQAVVGDYQGPLQPIMAGFLLIPVYLGLYGHGASRAAQEKLADLRELQQEVEIARHKGIDTPAVLRRRAAAAEQAFLGLAADLLGAPDPVPLLRTTVALTRTAAGRSIRFRSIV